MGNNGAEQRWAHRRPRPLELQETPKVPKVLNGSNDTPKGPESFDEAIAGSFDEVEEQRKQWREQKANYRARLREPTSSPPASC